LHDFNFLLLYSALTRSSMHLTPDNEANDLDFPW
jgi:hypothetical protein